MEALTYAQVCDWDNLYLAWRKAARGKRGRTAAARFEYRLEDNLVTLQAELKCRPEGQSGSLFDRQLVPFSLDKNRRRPIGPAPTPASTSMSQRSA